MQIIELFKYLLAKKSETPEDGGLLDFIASYLGEGWSAVRIDKEGVKNLFIYKKFGDGDHLCFAGHVDVVPAGKGWQHNPYEPFEDKEGFIFARGAQDMKSGVAAFVQACKEAEHFDGTLSILLTSDEEGDAKFGTKVVLEWLKEHDLLPDYAVVAEPTCEEQFGDAIKIGRRGSINGYLTIFGKQGHAAYPQKAINPVHLIAPKLALFAGVDFDDGDEYFAPSKLVITDIRGGMQVTNVTPDKLEIMFNVRNNTKTEQKDIVAFFENLLHDIEYELRLTQGSYPFMTDATSKVVQNIDRAIEAVTKIKPKHSTAGGTSDARFMAPLGIKVIEFGVKNDTIHAVNEKTHKSEVEGLYSVFSSLIKEWR